MQKEVMLFGILMLVAAFAFVFVPNTSITGAVTENSERNTYAYTLDDWVRNFFEIHALHFPDNACGNLAGQYYADFAFDALTIYEEMPAYGEEKANTILFGIEEEAAGSMELLHGKTLVQDGPDMINLVGHRMMRVPKLMRDTYAELTLKGDADNVFHVKSGRLRTGILDCSFTEDTCKCTAMRRYHYGALKMALEDWEY